MTHVGKNRLEASLLASCSGVFVVQFLASAEEQTSTPGELQSEAHFHFASPPPPPPDAIMPVSEVRAGMKGYGLTVFHGTRNGFLISPTIEQPQCPQVMRPENAKSCFTRRFFLV